jgi:site-specific DNA-cytosine methylase
MADGISSHLDVAQLEETRLAIQGKEVDLIRVATGIPERASQLKCLGNAVVPQVVEFVARNIIMKIL